MARRFVARSKKTCCTRCYGPRMPSIGVSPKTLRAEIGSTTNLKSVTLVFLDLIPIQFSTHLPN